MANNMESNSSAVNAENNEAEEEMTIDLELDDGRNVTCSIVTILEVEGKVTEAFDEFLDNSEFDEML